MDPIGIAFIVLLYLSLGSWAMYGAWWVFVLTVLGTAFYILIKVAEGRDG